MAPLHINVIRNIFAAGEHISPRLTGRAAFELFCRTPNPTRLTQGERKAVSRAKRFMDEARHHRLATPGDVSRSMNSARSRAGTGARRCSSCMAGGREQNTCGL